VPTPPPGPEAERTGRVETVTVSYSLAFLAGIVSFLSPCILPVVPAYVTFVSGVGLEELREGNVRGARRTAVLHAFLFAVGFGIVFMTLGAAATTAGRTLARYLPLMNRLGGGLIVLFGLYLAGLRIPGLSRELRLHLARKPAGLLGSVGVGVVFGAGWTPCIGPVLASILLYASLEATVSQGVTLLGVYALGLGIPFVLSAAAVNWLLLGAERVRRWIVPVRRAAGILLVVIGVLMVTGEFARLTAFLADLGQLVNLEIQ